MYQPPYPGTSYTPQFTPPYSYTSAPNPQRYPASHPGQIPSGTYQTNPYPYPPTNTYPPQPAQQQSWVRVVNFLPLTPQFKQYYSQIHPQELIGLQSWFNQVDRDHSGTIEVDELQNVTFDGRPIGIEVAAKLVQVFDEDRNGSINFAEYASMHKFITHMRQAFMAADTDRSGRIEANEIYQALTNAGFNYLTMGSILELLNKFDKTRLGLDWQEFLMMAATVAHVRSVFEWNDKQSRGVITINLDQLTQISAYLA